MSSELIDLTAEDSVSNAPFESSSSGPIPCAMVPNHFCDLTVDSSTEDEEGHVSSNAANLAQIDNDSMADYPIVLDDSDDEIINQGCDDPTGKYWDSQSLPYDFSDVYCSHAEEDDDDKTKDEMLESPSYSQEVTQLPIFDSSYPDYSSSSNVAEKLENESKKVTRPVGRPRKKNSKIIVDTIKENPDQNRKVGRPKKILNDSDKAKVLNKSTSSETQISSGDVKGNDLKGVQSLSLSASVKNDDKRNTNFEDRKTSAKKKVLDTNIKVKRRLRSSSTSKMNSSQILLRCKSSRLPTSNVSKKISSVNNRRAAHSVTCGNQLSSSLDKLGLGKTMKRSAETVSKISAKKPRFLDNVNSSQTPSVKRNSGENITQKPVHCGRPRKVNSVSHDSSQDLKKRRKKRSHEVIENLRAKKPRLLNTNKNSITLKVESNQEKDANLQTVGQIKKIQSSSSDGPGRKGTRAFGASKKSNSLETKAHKISQDKPYLHNAKSTVIKTKLKKSVKILTCCNRKPIVLLDKLNLDMDGQMYVKVQNTKKKTNVLKEKKEKRSGGKPLSKKVSEMRRKHAKKLVGESRKKLNNCKGKKKIVQKRKLQKPSTKDTSKQNLKPEKKKYVKKSLGKEARTKHSKLNQQLKGKRGKDNSVKYSLKQSTCVKKRGKIGMKLRLNKNINETRQSRSKKHLGKCAEHLKQKMECDHKRNENELKTLLQTIDNVVSRRSLTKWLREQESFRSTKDQSDSDSNLHLTTDSNDDVDDMYKFFPDPEVGYPTLEVDTDMVTGNEDSTVGADIVISNRYRAEVNKSQHPRSSCGISDASLRDDHFFYTDRNNFDSWHSNNSDGFRNTRNVSDSRNTAHKLPIIPPNPSKKPVSIFYCVRKTLVTCDHSHACCRQSAVKKVDKSVQCEINETLPSHTPSLFGINEKTSVIKERNMPCPPSDYLSDSDMLSMDAKIQHNTKTSSSSTESASESEDNNPVRDIQDKNQVRVQINPNFPQIYTVRRKSLKAALKTTPKLENSDNLSIRSSQSLSSGDRYHQNTYFISTPSSSKSHSSEWLNSGNAMKEASFSDLMQHTSVELRSANCVPMELPSSFSEKIEKETDNNLCSSVNFVNSKGAISLCDIECDNSQILGQNDVENGLFITPTKSEIMSENLKKVVENVSPNTSLFHSNTNNSPKVSDMTHQNAECISVNNSETHALPSLNVENAMECDNNDGVHENLVNTFLENNAFDNENMSISMDNVDIVTDKATDSTIKSVGNAADNAQNHDFSENIDNHTDVSPITNNIVSTIENVENATENMSNVIQGNDRIIEPSGELVDNPSYSYGVIKNTCAVEYFDNAENTERTMKTFRDTVGNKNSSTDVERTIGSFCNEREEMDSEIRYENSVMTKDDDVIENGNNVVINSDITAERSVNSFKRNLENPLVNAGKAKDSDNNSMEDDNSKVVDVCVL